MRFFLFFLIPFFLYSQAHVFVYHRFADPKHASTSTPLSELKKNFEYLKKENYKVITLAKLVEKIRKKEDINKTVALTIDDGYKSFYTHAYPLFKKYNYPFTLFVYAKATEKRYGDFMTWKEIKEVSELGEIALHSYSHPHLTKLSQEKVFEDTNLSKTLFEKRLGFSPTGYSYPYGEFNENVKKTVKSFSFSYIANQNSGVVTHTSDLYDIDRIALTEKVSLKRKLALRNLPIRHFHVTVENNHIVSISGESELKKVEIYITGHGWKWVNLKKKKLSYKPNLPLKNFRNRIIIRYNNAIISKLVTKEL